MERSAHVFLFHLSLHVSLITGVRDRNLHWLPGQGGASFFKVTGGNGKREGKEGREGREGEGGADGVKVRWWWSLFFTSPAFTLLLRQVGRPPPPLPTPTPTPLPYPFSYYYYYYHCYCTIPTTKITTIIIIIVIIMKIIIVIFPTQRLPLPSSCVLFCSWSWGGRLRVLCDGVPW